MPTIKQPQIAILLATHNGANYIQRQLDSLTKQQLKTTRILVYDDHSSDDTLEQLRRHSCYNSVTLMESQQERLGAAGSFAQLLKAAKETNCDYFAFCDQDDEWHPDKLRLQLSKLNQCAANCPELPLLIHSDLAICDQDLNPIAASYMTYTRNRHEPPARALKTLVRKNFVTGCSLLFNRPLLELAEPIPDCVLMHDWWLALCAAATGEIGYIDRPLVKYRQHSSNLIGASNSRRQIRQRLGQGWRQMNAEFIATCLQAGALAQRLTSSATANADPATVRILRQYTSLLSDNRLLRIRKMVQHCCHHQRPLLSLAFLTQLLFSRRIHR